MPARKPLNPEGSGKGSMPALGRSSQSASAAANKRAGAGAAAKKAMAAASKALNPFGSRLTQAATRVSRAAKAKGTARESMLNYEVSQYRGNQSFANELRGFPKSGYQLDQNVGFRNIARTTRRSDVQESAQEIASRLSKLQRSRRGGR